MMSAGIILRFKRTERAYCLLSQKGNAAPTLHKRERRSIYNGVKTRNISVCGPDLIEAGAARVENRLYELQYAVVS